MRIRSHINFNVAVLKFVLIYLFSAFSTLVFAQNSNFSSRPTAGEKNFILIETKNNSLNVRKDPSASSRVVGKVLKGSEVPLIGMNGDGGADGNWYRVEIEKGRIGWVSKNYSRKIKKSNKKLTARPENTGGNDRAPDKTLKKTKPWARIDGFRLAKFGMTMKNVKKAIQNDFSMPDREITTINQPTERTKSLAVTVDKLLSESSKSRVVYVFGYKSKRLIQVNILTGHPLDTNATLKQLMNSGNFLGNHFLKKRYQEEGLVVNSKLSDGSILMFRGKDQEGRMVLLHVPANDNAKDLQITLNLSYIEKPGRPDIYKFKKLKNFDF